jgi:acetyl-CoA decarbonylase/synthase complex subunit delta
MEYKAPLETYTGRVKEVTLGKGADALKIGGGNILPLHYFEGSVVNRPVVALEVNDNGAAGWAEWVVEPYKDVVSDPVKWARKCLSLGADLICLHLDSTDPQGSNRSAMEAAAMVKKVRSEVDVPQWR